MTFELTPPPAPMWRVWLKTDKPGDGPYWYVDGVTTEADARKKMARMAGRKMEDYEAAQPVTMKRNRK